MITARPLSRIAPDWWDYTTLDPQLLRDAAALDADDLPGLARPGFEIAIHDTREEFYLAEALEYIEAWREATPSRPAGICGPIGPNRAAAAGGATGERARAAPRARALLGHGRLGRGRRARRA
jgi:hypothetical protein